VTQTTGIGPTAPLIQASDGKLYGTAWGGGTGSTGTVFVVDAGLSPKLQSISVLPSSTSVAAGLTQQFSATGHYSDNSTKDLTASVTWSSSNTALATISNTAPNQGLATGVAADGPVTITATSGQIQGTAQLTVTAPVLVSLTVTPANASVPQGGSQPFTATGTYSDGSTQNITASVTWGSSNTAVATISASGVATALTAGSTMISAQQGSVSNSTTMTVTVPLQSLTIDPVHQRIFVGDAVQFAVTAHYSDGSTRDLTLGAAWISSRTAVATISSGGVATGIARGRTTITATVGTLSASTTLTVHRRRRGPPIPRTP
jgi:hypothetical protein